MNIPGSSACPVNIAPCFRAFTGVRTSAYDIQRILNARGVIATREHPELRGAIEWRVHTGSLVPVLPGVYAPAASAELTSTRIAAVPAWDRNAVLTHEAAASVFFWPKLRVPTIRCAVRHHRPPRPGYQFSRGRIPAELVWQYGRLNLTAPALTALDLCESLGGEAIDHALLTRATTLPLMRQALALTAGRTGNLTRRQLLLDSRDEPWSEAEREFHRLLRVARITGWKGNQPIRMAGRKVYADVVFRRLRLVVEVDGREFHSDPEVFESDRHRQNLLVLHGWRVLRVTWAMIRDDPDQVVGMVREAIAASVAA